MFVFRICRVAEFDIHVEIELSMLGFVFFGFIQRVSGFRFGILARHPVEQLAVRN